MQYHAPTTIPDALALLARDAGARILAGGTDLLVRMQGGQRPEAVVDIKRIEALRQITESEAGFRIGAAVSGAQMNEHPALAAAWPGVVEAAGLIGSTQIQGRATLAGNLCNASPAADSVPAMVAASAQVEIAGPQGLRIADARDIPAGPGKTSLAPGEFVTALLLPPCAPRSADAYLRFIPRTEMDIAVVGCGAWVRLAEDGAIAEARIALGAVGPTVMRVTEAEAAATGAPVTEATLAEIARAASAAATPIDDKRGTIAFRTHIAGVLAKRATTLAATRAAGESQ